VNRHALEVLEFSDALRTVAARAGSELARDSLLSRTPGTDPDAVRDELLRVAETLRLLRSRPEWAPPIPPDARPPLGTLGVEGGVLDPEGLLLLLRLLQGSRELAAVLTDLEDDESPGLRALRALLPVHPRHEEWMAGIVDEEGEIRDDATPDLKSLRSRIRDARSRIVQRLEAFLGGLPERIRVPDASVSVREGRYVIPIRREGRSEVGGVIHGESGTGATLFVEPPLALQLMNELHGLERDEAREVQRILRDASGRLRPLAPELEGGLAALVDFDTLWARALTARRWEAEPPEILAPEVDELEVVHGRHPLLLEQGEGEVIPFDLSLSAEERAMVVSGPNTGGKTVFLKALGLTHLLAQAGIVPPVGPGTRLPVIRDVFADIGDEQSIARSLSTFSAHLANAREIVEGAGPGTLVLMDEMGTGTDPTEGAALARAVLETLVERGARAVVTSHLGALKRLDSEGSGIVNASLLFDPDRLAPTYRLSKGRPGRSYGLAIARRLGFPGEVLDRAETYVDSRELDADRLLESLEERERELAAALAEAEEARDRALTLLADARERESELERREKGAEARARDEARQMLMEAREEVEEAIRSLREAGESGQEEAVVAARRTVEEAARRHREARPQTGSRDTGPLPELAGGDRVRLMESGARGVVTQVEGDRATVDVGGIRMELPLDRLEVVGGGSAAGPGGPDAKPSVRTGGGALPDLPARTEADLRGLRVDEVEMALGRALDGAVVAGLPELLIIHGKGTGAVKARVRELLKGDPRVAELRAGGPGEGGAGVTVAVLR
jgi:DNA mismatch repair protein MutS2